MQKLVVISDIHMTVAGTRIVGLDPLIRLRSVLCDAVAAHPDATRVILLGDLTHHGLPAEYERLRGALDDIPIPILPLLGNHDRRSAFLAAFPDTKRSDGGFVQTVTDLGDYRLITLDSFNENDHAGVLCPARLAFLDEALNTDRKVLVFVYHPPFDTGLPGMDAIKLADGADFLDRLAAASVTHLFCGHVHLTMSGQSRGVAWTLFKSPCHQGVIDLQSENISLSSNAPGGYGLILLGRDGVAVHHQDVATPAHRIFSGYDDA